MAIGVDPHVVPTPMRGAPLQRHFNPRKSFVRRCDGQSRGFGNDRPRGLKSLRQQRARADRFVLFVAHGGDDDLAHQRSAGRGPGRRDAHGGQTTLHIRRAAPVQLPVVHRWLKGRVRHPNDINHIEMPVQHQRCTPRRADAGDDVGAPRRNLRHRHRKPPRLQNRGEIRGTGTLPGSIRCQ